MKLEENGVQEKFAIRAATTVAIESATTDKIFLDLIAATTLGLVAEMGWWRDGGGNGLVVKLWVGGGGKVPQGMSHGFVRD